MESLEQQLSTHRTLLEWHCCDTITNLCYTSLAILFVHLQTDDREKLVNSWSLWDEFQIHNSNMKGKIKTFSSYLYKLRSFQADSHVRWFIYTVSKIDSSPTSRFYIRTLMMEPRWVTEMVH
jgi:hypothetical protein